jgi:multiple sugar transport system permease protein
MRTSAPATMPGRKLQVSRTKSGQLGLALLFILPAVSLVAVLMYYPMLRTVYLSFFETSMLRPQPQYVGLEQYRELFASSAFWTILRNSLLWTSLVVIFQAIIGLLTAILLNQNLPAQGFLRALVLLPWVLPGVVAAILWRFMYDPQLGLVNALLISANILHERVPWLAQPSTALAALIVAAVWKGFPFSTLMYLAALQGVDRQLIEAAKLDGANAWQQFRHVTLPAISGIIRLSLLLTTLWTFNYFEMIWVTTRGGPGNSTHIFPTIIYELGFGRFNFGAASAYGVIAMIGLSLFAVFFVREMFSRE